MSLRLWPLVSGRRRLRRWVGIVGRWRLLRLRRGAGLVLVRLRRKRLAVGAVERCPWRNATWDG